MWDVLQAVHMPLPAVEKFKKIAEEYNNIWNFPQCLEAVDGKHVFIICSAHSGTVYLSYKLYYSIVLQGWQMLCINLQLLMLMVIAKKKKGQLRIQLVSFV